MKKLVSLLVAGLSATTGVCAALNEDFSTDPIQTGWQTFGEADLFHWDRAAGNLTVTWDSTRSNSYFYRALGTALSQSDDFALSFDLVLHDITVGVSPGKPFTFELAVGLFDKDTATGTNFVRGTGTQAANLVEFDYFPDSGFGASISPVIISRTGQFIPSFSFPFELTGDDLFRIEMRYASSNQTLVTTMQRNGQAFGPIKDVRLGTNFTDFKVDAVAISSYSDTGAGGSIRAHGTIDNITVELPRPPRLQLVGRSSDAHWCVAFDGLTDFIYSLERTDSWQDWHPVAGPVAGSGQAQELVDQTEPSSAGYGFYRLRAERR